MVTVIIIAVVVVLIVGGYWLTRRKKEEGDVTPGNTTVVSNSNIVATGWGLKTLDTGEKTTVNKKKVEVSVIALVFDGTPKKNYTYNAKFTWTCNGEEQPMISASGNVSPGARFILQGKDYYGAILASGPKAEIANIEKLSVY